MKKIIHLREGDTIGSFGLEGEIKEYLKSQGCLNEVDPSWVYVKNDYALIIEVMEE